MNGTPRAVFDTQIFLRAMINRRSACGKLVLDLRADYQLYTTDFIDEEILDVLTRHKIREKSPQITDSRVGLVRVVLELAHRVEVQPEDIEPICRDPNDDIFLACAKLAEADYLVSEDKDLLALQKHGKVSIVDVAAFLNILQSRREE